MFVVVLVDWMHGAAHMWDRHQVSVAEADEALADPDAVWYDPDPNSKSGNSVRVIGFSHSRRQVLSIILVYRDDGSESYWGANGWPSNSSDQRRYERGQ